MLRKSKRSLFKGSAKSESKTTDVSADVSEQASTTDASQAEPGRGKVKTNSKAKPLTDLETLEKAAAKKKAQKIQEHLEQLEYNKFPTILGWYFDGSFTPNFGLNEEYAEYFCELEENIQAKQDLLIEETFTEKTLRNFWPPHFFGHFFRTRGVYLDLKEVKEDPPKTPPEMNFERHHATFGIGLNDGEDEQEGGKIQFGDVEYASASGRRPNDKRDLYYWTDDTREFLLKDEGEEYEWFEEDKVWRKSDPVDRTPYSWYWNQREGKYFIRNKAKREDYIFDQHANIYKKKGMEGRSKNGLGPTDYFYCENTNKWIPLSEAVTGETEMYENGKREIKKGPRGATGLGSDDYYYSSESGKMEKKTEAIHEYYYDTKDQMFKRYTEGYGPGKTGLYPTDYKFSNTAGEWLPKSPKELYRMSPYDWYFDSEKGRFYLLDKTQRDDYVFDQQANVWKLKGVTGPSANELGPEDYVYDELAKAWKLENSYPYAEDVQKFEPGKRKICKGLRGKSGKLPDDYYYDSLLGEFALKDETKLASYFYDTVDEVFRKRGQPYGPGKSKLLPSQYYFDEVEGRFEATAEARTLIARNQNKQAPKLAAVIFRTPYDFAFDAHSGTFVERDPSRPNDYEYNADTAVYYRRGTKGPSINGKGVRDYFFDEAQYAWFPLESPKGHEARDYKNGRRNNRFGLRGKSGKIPDDFYFSGGKFLEKDLQHPELYTFHPDVGVWKLADAPPEQAGQSSPSDYFFSYEEGQFILKKDLKYGEIVLDKNTMLWVQKLRIPSDWVWNGRIYILNPAKYKAVVIPQGDTPEDKLKPKKKEEKDYERPWLNYNPYLAADKQRFIQEIEKRKSQKDLSDVPSATGGRRSKSKKKKPSAGAAGEKKKSNKNPEPEPLGSKNQKTLKSTSILKIKM